MPDLDTQAERSRCGTQAGYQRHLDYGEPTCADCRRANAERSRAIRAERGRSNPKRERRWAAAHSRAVAQLAREYPERYRELLHLHLTQPTTEESS